MTYLLDKLSSLTPQWMAASNGDVPKNAFNTGCKARDGTPLYVIKAKYKFMEIPGVLNPSLAFAFVPWGFKAHKMKEYKVLLNKNGLGWRSMKNGLVPPGAIVVSKENDSAIRDKKHSIYSVRGIQY